MSSDPGAGDIFSKLRAKFRGDEDIDGQRKLNKILNKCEKLLLFTELDVII